MMSLQRNIAAFIQTIMKRDKKSLSDFSEELGISRNALYDYSTGVGNPTILTLEHIAERMGVNPAALLLGAGEQKQREIWLLLLETIPLATELTAEKRRCFVELFLEMVRLWDSE